MAQPVGPDLLYTREITDPELARKFRDDPASLGSISIGFADRGRVINAVQMPDDPVWIVERPTYSYGTRETIDGLALVFRTIRRQFPESARRASATWAPGTADICGPTVRTRAGA